MKSLVEVLADSIEDWLDKRKSRNLNLLARNSGVSYATVRRVAAKETSVSAEVAASLASVVMEKSQAKMLLSQYFPSLSSILYMESSFEGTADDLLLSYYNSPEHMPVLMLATAKEGIDEKLVKERLGIRYLSYFNELVEADVFEEKNNRFFVNKEISIASREAGRRHLKALLEVTSNRNDNIPCASGAYMMHKCLTPKAVRLLRQKTVEFKQEIFNVINSEENQGEVLWYAGWLDNVLLNEELLK